MFRFLLNQLIQLLSNIGEFFDLVLRSFSSGRSEDDGPKRSWFVRALLFPFAVVKWIVVTTFVVLTLPFSSFSRMSSTARRDFYWGIPALLLMIAVVSVGGVALATRGSIENRYRFQMQSAIAASEFDQAKLLCGRLMAGHSVPDQQTMLTYADLLMRTNEPQRAEAIINQLAPDDVPGNAVAHKMRAFALYKTWSTASDTSLLEKLRWHLRNGGTSPELDQLWAVYYMAIGEEESAVLAMESAARSNPQLLLNVADLNKKIGNISRMTRVLKEAEEKFERILKSDPYNTDVRVMLAVSRIRQEKFKEAEDVLLTGLNIKPDPTIVRATAEYFVLRHDHEVKNRGSIGEQLRYLQRALEVDVNALSIYERIIGLYRRTDAEKQEIKESLYTAIASGESSPLGHFALGNVFWVDLDGVQKKWQRKELELSENGMHLTAEENELKAKEISEVKEKANWELKQAYNQDKKFAVIGNNLAWILANNDPPELDQALELATAVVEQVPNDARFRDTLATVLMKCGESEKAIIEFEKALPGLKDRVNVHISLSKLYAEIGQDALARQHERLAEQATKKK